MVVDPHAAEAQGFGDAQRTPDVAGPHRGSEAVAGRVGPGDRLLLVGEALHGYHRTEDLTLDHLVVLLQARDYRGLQKEAGPVGLAAPGHDLGALRAALEEALDALALALG